MPHACTHQQSALALLPCPALHPPACLPSQSSRAVRHVQKTVQKIPNHVTRNKGPREELLCVDRAAGQVDRRQRPHAGAPGAA